MLSFSSIIGIILSGSEITYVHFDVQEALQTVEKKSKEKNESYIILCLGIDSSCTYWLFQLLERETNLLIKFSRIIFAGW